MDGTYTLPRCKRIKTSLSFFFSVNDCNDEKESDSHLGSRDQVHAAHGDAAGSSSPSCTSPSSRGSGSENSRSTFSLARQLSSTSLLLCTEVTVRPNTSFTFIMSYYANVANM